MTLVCDDQTQFKAHKIVLSACSPVFKKIIDNNPTQHPLIYLRGIQSYEMESILQFMYLGEGRCFYERMGEFIKVAKDLEINEISKKGLVIPKEEEDITEEAVMNYEKKKIEEDWEDDKESSKNQIIQRLNQSQVSRDRSEHPSITQSDLQKPVESEHDGIKYLLYPCNQCDSQFIQQNHLQTHIQSKHEGVKYPCNQCDYQATQQGTLQRHIQSKHKGIKYPCDQCDYQATQQSNLQVHIQSKHEGIKYPCNQCDNQFTKQAKLQRHIRSCHA